MHSTQYQYRLFKNVDYFRSLHKQYFDKPLTCLFSNDPMQIENR